MIFTYDELKTLDDFFSHLRQFDYPKQLRNYNEDSKIPYVTFYPGEIPYDFFNRVYNKIEEMCEDNDWSFDFAAESCEDEDYINISGGIYKNPEMADNDMSWN